MMIAASKSPSTAGATLMSRTPGKAMNCCAAGSTLTTVTCLPSARRPNAIASWEPIESPSGREWEEITNRCRACSSAVICLISGSVAAIGVVTVAGVAGLSAVAVALLVGCMDFVQQLFDPVLPSDGLIVLELQLGHALQTETRADLAPQKGRCPVERTRAVLARRLVAKDRVEDAGLLDVRAHLDARERHEPDAGIVDFTRKQLGQFAADLVGDTIGPRTLGHASKRSP